MELAESKKSHPKKKTVDAPLNEIGSIKMSAESVENQPSYSGSMAFDVKCMNVQSNRLMQSFWMK